MAGSGPHHVRGVRLAVRDHPGGRAATGSFKAFGGTPAETARRHNPGVEQETTEPKQAYARFGPSERTRYVDGLLPG